MEDKFVQHFGIMRMVFCLPLRSKDFCELILQIACHCYPPNTVARRLRYSAILASQFALVLDPRFAPFANLSMSLRNPPTSVRQCGILPGDWPIVRGICSSK